MLDYFKFVSNTDIDKRDYLYNVLKNYSCHSKSYILDKEMIKLYFTDEQLDVLKTEQKELGYEDNFSRFVRYALFNYFIIKNDVVLINKPFGKLINTKKFDQLSEKYENELLNCEYTSYDLDLLRNNEKYESKISFDEFDKYKNDVSFNFDFLEYDMLSFLEEKFKNGCKYSKLVGLSTEQNVSEAFTIVDGIEKLKPFVDYNNIVPDTDSFYYLYIYCVFNLNFRDLNEDSDDYLDIDEIFDETNEHIYSLLEKYTFERVLKHYREAYNIIDVNIIFDEGCLESLKTNETIDFDIIIESNETVGFNEILEPNPIVDSIGNIETEEII